MEETRARNETKSGEKKRGKKPGKCGKNLRQKKAMGVREGPTKRAHFFWVPFSVERVRLEGLTHCRREKEGTSRKEAS